MTRERINVVCDCDAVLADSKVPVTAAVNKMLRVAGFGQSALFQPQDINDWHFFKLAVERLTGDRDLAQRCHDMWFDGATLRKSPVMPYAKLAILTMRSLNIEPFAVTSRLPSLRDSTKYWFWDELPDFVRNGRVIIREEGDTRGSGEFKRDQIEILKAKAFFEDDPAAIDVVRGSGVIPRNRIKMMKAGWNEQRDDLDDIRVDGWLEAIPFILKLRVSK